MAVSPLSDSPQPRVGIPSISALEMDFPSSMLSHVATKESWRKEVHRPATSTHKWWAKRLGTVFRGILASAVSQSGEDAEAKYTEGVDLSGLVVFDPFAGSGVVPVEAAKLGARVVAFDINPVATLVERQALQKWDFSALQRNFKLIEASCRREIDRVHSDVHGDTVLYYFWIAIASCPECSKETRLFDSPVFAKHAYSKKFPQAQLVCPVCLDIQQNRYDFTEATCRNGHRFTNTGAVKGKYMTCEDGHMSTVTSSLNGEIPKYEMFAKIVVSGQGVKRYDSIDQFDLELYQECSYLNSLLPPTTVRPVGDLAAGINTNQALRWNFNQWSLFFNPRQAYCLSLIATEIRNLPSSAEREALTALFSGTLEFNNRFASFKGEGTGAVRHMFSHHILKPERTPLEAHPWGTTQSSGSFSTLFKSRILRAHNYKSTPEDLLYSNGDVTRALSRSHSIQLPIASSWAEFVSMPRSAYVATRSSAATDIPDASVDVILTDPPYMDNVHYAELADFFHAWLKQMAPFTGYSAHPTTRREGEVQDADPERFGKSITAVWRECARVVKPGGLLAFTFHQARISGWVQLIDSLRSSGWAVTSVQPVKGEMSTSITKSGVKEPSNLDSVVVCRLVDHQPTVLRPLTLEDAYTTALKRLQRLAADNISVGAGDVRSVMRGSLLAWLAARGEDLDDHLTTVDKFASAAVDVAENFESSVRETTLF